MPHDKNLPAIIGSRNIASTALFVVQEDLVRFGDGVERQLERIEHRSGPVVMVVPLHTDRLVLVREYCAGTRQYELAFPTGTAIQGESIEEAAKRELREEVGLDAKSVSRLATLRSLPGHFDHQTHVLLVQGLFASPLHGDEPEPPEVVEVPLARAEALVAAGELTEARSVAALMLMMERLNREGPHVALRRSDSAT
jgi:ADP-ribose diphosphatase